MLRAALAALAMEPDIAVEAMSPVLASAPLGPSRRRYANAAAVLVSPLSPRELLARLHAIEGQFGRRRRGRRWLARPLDLDIVLWSGGAWTSPGLTIPHLAFRQRSFVLTPSSAIARGWRDPLGGLTLAQLEARLHRPHPVDRHRPRA